MPQTIRETVFRFAFENAVREHADLWDSWRTLEGKTQGTSAVAGVFMAAMVAFVAQVGDRLTTIERGLATAVLIALTAAVVQALRATQVADVPTPHRGIGNYRDARKIADETARPEDAGVRFEDMVADEVELWSRESDKMREVLLQKRRLLTSSQRWLFGAVLTSALFVLVALWTCGH